MTGVHVAALMTCHNRAERTRACLQSLSAQEDVSGVQFDVVLVDAGSTDGTREMVRRDFPEVELIERGADLFWNGGMRVALAHAYELDPDFYLWLNDDVELDRDAISTLLGCHRERLHSRALPSIIVGSTRDPATGRLTYGGVIRPDRLRPMHYELVYPGDDPRAAETMNGNCVLVPREVVSRIGNLAAVYTHGMGDYDYGHRAARSGCEVWVAPGTIGTCSRNPPREPAGSLGEHRRLSVSPTTGLPPSEWLTFTRRWAGPLWPVYAASPFVRRFARWFAAR